MTTARVARTTTRMASGTLGSRRRKRRKPIRQAPPSARLKGWVSGILSISSHRRGKNSSCWSWIPSILPAWLEMMIRRYAVEEADNHRSGDKVGNEANPGYPRNDQNTSRQQGLQRRQRQETCRVASRGHRGQRRGHQNRHRGFRPDDQLPGSAENPHILPWPPGRHKDR